MTLRTLAVRTRRSFLGLYKAEEQPPVPETRSKSPPMSPKDGASVNLEDFGLSPSSNHSPRTESPSRRSNKLARSLRKMRSSFDVMKTKANHGADSPVRLDKTPSLKARPSLALVLDSSSASFVSKGTSPTSSEAGIHIQRSSPIAVPGIRQSTPPPKESFPGGTIPDTPGHLTKAMQASPGFSDSTGSSPEHPELSAVLAMREPLPTPMPGTNLSLEDIKPSPSVPMGGYFSLSMVANEGLRDSTERTPGLSAGSASRSRESSKEDLSAELGCVEEWQRVDSRITTALQNLEEHRRMKAGACEANSTTVNCQVQVAEAESPDCKEKLARRESKWGRHDGLYDGSGYASPSPNQSYTTVSIDITDAPASLADGAIRECRYSMSSRAGRSSMEDREDLHEIIRAYTVLDEEEPGSRDTHTQGLHDRGNASEAHRRSIGTQTDKQTAVY